MTGDAGTLKVFPDLNALSRAAAGLFVEMAGAAISRGGRAHVALSGGRTPRGLFSLLASAEFRGGLGLDWSRMHFFWADERCVPPESPDSNYGEANRLMLSKLPIPPANIRRIMGELGPERAALEYERGLMSCFGGAVLPAFDLVLLGVGEDGHIASLFPGGSQLGETARLAVPVHMDAPGVSRVTLTLPVINNAVRVVFLVSGKSKAHVVTEVIEGGADKGLYPAGLVGPKNGKVIWLIDRDAASGLERPGAATA